MNRDIAKLPDASTSVREWIRHPGASVVVPNFAALGLSESPQHTDPDEFVEPFRIPFAEAVVSARHLCSSTFCGA